MEEGKARRISLQSLAVPTLTTRLCASSRRNILTQVFVSLEISALCAAGLNRQALRSHRAASPRNPESVSVHCGPVSQLNEPVVPSPQLFHSRIFGKFWIDFGTFWGTFLSFLALCWLLGLVWGTFAPKWPTRPRPEGPKAKKSKFLESPF